MALKIKSKKAAFFLSFFLLLNITALQDVRARDYVVYDQDREIAAALSSMKDRKWRDARIKIAAIDDPLAAQLHQWMVFQSPDAMKDQSHDDFSALKEFIRGHKDWPLLDRLKASAEENIPSNLPGSVVIDWFNDYPPATTEGVDRYVGALIGAGQKEKAALVLDEWWSKALIPREDQKKIYRKYKDMIGRQANLRRLDALLLNKNYSNARAIAAVLGENYERLAEARIGLAENSGNVQALVAAVPKHLRDDAGLMYERLRWRRGRDMNDGMVEIFNEPPDISDIQNPEAWWRERHILIRRYIETKDFRKAYALAKSHIQTTGFSYSQAEWMSGWLALRFLNMPAAALKHFQAFYDFVERPISRARGAYWIAKAYQSMGNGEEFERWMGIAAQTQTVFYGQLAALELSMDKKITGAPPPVLSAQDQSVMRRDELIRAALILHRAGFEFESKRFIDAYVGSKKTPQAYKFAAELAAELKYYDQAVKIAKAASYEGMFLTAQAYPVINDLLARATHGLNVEWALIHALIRQESLFDREAKSSAGARGLMQLMPATARITAKKMGMGYELSYLTQKPEYNIRLGASYIGELLDRYDRSYPLAIAAYNAGPGRVDRWLKENGDPRKREISFVDWIEMIPIYETRNYVQRVTEGLYIYRLRLRELSR